jgi:UDP-glucose 4-epimerase
MLELHEKSSPILVTGGLGFIGSHTCVELINSGFEVILLDSLINSKKSVLAKIEKITGKKVRFLHADICEPKSLRKIFEKYAVRVVMHFAGLKSINESLLDPLRYYQNNIYGTLNLCRIMSEYGVKKLIFSSSATVYGNSSDLPIKESFPVGATTNPYGRSKFVVENILSDLCRSDPSWSILLLRYFNPVGAHPSGLIGEDPNGVPSNLMPYITQVAAGKLPFLKIYGSDYPTSDGTGVRDYIHVVDLALGHIASINYLNKHAGIKAINLGTGTGYSVLEVVNTFARVCNSNVPYKFLDRRDGDVPSCYANTDLAFKLFGWKSKFGLEKMCLDAWNWESKIANKDL